jgi:predicted transcriptional regulator
MCTGGLAGIGALVDFFTLPRQVREANYRNAIFNGVRQQNGPYRYVNDGQTRPVKGKESLQHIILTLAKQNKGILTASELALEANIPIEDAKKDLDALVSKGFAEIRVRKTGTIVYTLPELMDNDSPLEDW